MNGHSAALISVLLAVLLSSVQSRPHMNEELFSSLILRGYRPYSGRTILSYLEPRRVTRQGNDFSGGLARRSYYTPTPCRWKLCASLFRQ